VHALAASETRAEHAERLAEIGTLVSAVAHEVRNPLGVLTAHLKILDRGGAEPETVAAMQEQIARATRFVDDLLRYGRPRPIERRVIDLPATVELGYSTARQGLDVDSSGVRIDFDQPEHATIEGDQAQLSQVFVILFENALLALREIDGATIEVNTGVEDGAVWITIEDNGPGIPEAIRARLFQPFVTGRKRQGPRPGTGLGLATARGIVERHGGQIDAKQRDAGGACFALRLPVSSSTAREIPPSTPTTANSS